MSRRSRSRGQLLSVLEVVLDNTNTTPNSTATNDEGANGSSSCLSSHGDNEDEDMRPLSALRSLTRIDKRRKNETLLAKTSTKDSGRSESGSNQVDLDFHLDSDQDDEDLNSGDGDLNDDDDKEDDADFVAESSSSSSSSSSARNTRRVLRAETPHTKSSARSKSTQFIMGGAASVLSLATRRHSVSVCSNIRRRAILDEEEEEEGGIDDREETSNKADYRPFRRRTPSRASAVKATRNFGDSAWTRDKDEADDDDDTVDCKPMAQKNRKTKRNGSKHNKKADDDDDEFVLESDDQEDEENLSDGGSSSSSQQDNNDADSKQGTNERGLHEENRRNSHVGIVQEGEIGDADEDEEDENASRTKNYRPTYRSPQLVVVQPTVRRRSNGTLLFDCESSDDNYDTDMNDDDNVDLVCTQCQSMRDVVTDDDLPTRHVCFFPPDQKNPQCFALETLRKIALTAAHPSYRTDRNGQQIQTFLQPPHFRTALSDNLLDQIASRFGRDALDLHGSYYGRKDENNGAIPSNWSAAAAAAATHPQGSKSDTFIEQLERYIRNRMGHQDVYCCPLCYIATHCQLVSIPKDANDHSSEEENDDHSNTQGLERYSTEFTQDPMTVLGYLDNDAFRIASTFCFTKVAALKEHLRKDHNVDTKKVQGNELYARFKIRDQDGLLQRYLTRNTGKWGITRQGAMMSYWFHGNNASFVLLLSLIAQAVVCRELIHEGDAHSDKEAVEMAHDFFSSAYDFYESFADDAHNVWNMVTSPFSRATKAEINDFIEDDESVLAEEEVNAMSHRALHMKAELEKFRDQHADAQILAARYEHLEGAVDPDDGDGFDPEGNQSDSECQSEEEIAGREYDSSEVEDDDWQKSILDKRVAKRKSQIPLDRSRRRVSLSDSKMSLPKQSHPVCTLTQMQSSDEEDEFVPPTSAGRRRLAIQDSDDD